MPRQRAFTLIELMVVAAIILLLVAILLPTLDKAQEMAAVSICATNQRQLQLATIAYSSDNYNIFPPCKQAIALKWDGSTDSKDDENSTASEPITRLDQSLLWRYFKNPDVLMCPIFKSTTGDNALRSYSMNWNAGSEKAGSHLGNQSLCTINKIKHPATFGLFTEENQWSFAPYSNAGINDADFVCQTWPTQDTIATYHLPEVNRYADASPYAYVPTHPDDLLNTGVGNVVFADGHVALVETTKTKSVMYDDHADFVGLPAYTP